VLYGGSHTSTHTLYTLSISPVQPESERGCRGCVEVYTSTPPPQVEQSRGSYGGYRLLLSVLSVVVVASVLEVDTSTGWWHVPCNTSTVASVIPPQHMGGSA
jgi:hypothetical protein